MDKSALGDRMRAIDHDLLLGKIVVMQSSATCGAQMDEQDGGVENGKTD